MYIRWLGASTRLTGIKGALDGTGIEVLGRLGRGYLTFGPFCEVAGLRWPLPGVEGNDDGRRGVSFMACSHRRSLRSCDLVLCCRDFRELLVNGEKAGRKETAGGKQNRAVSQIPRCRQTIEVEVEVEVVLIPSWCFGLVWLYFVRVANCTVLLRTERINAQFSKRKAAPVYIVSGGKEH